MNRPPKRLFLINRDFQLRYAYAATLVGIISTVFTGVVLLYPLYAFEILRIPRFLPTPILASMIFAVLFNISIITLLGVLATHKIAGPVFNLVKFFRRVEQGIYSGKMRTREGDDLQYVVRNLNNMLNGLRFQTTHIINKVEGLEQHLNDNNTDALKEDLAKLKQHLQVKLSAEEFEGEESTVHD